MTAKPPATAGTPSPTDTAWLIIGRLIAGVAIYGGIGWLLGLWLGNETLFAAIGVVFGLAASLLLIYYRLTHESAADVEALEGLGRMKRRSSEVTGG